MWTVPSDEGVHFVLLEDLLTLFAQDYFADQKILEIVPFRTMRNADVELDERAADLLAGMKSMLLERRTSDCVRLEVFAEASHECVDFLKTCLEVEDDQIYRVPGPMDLGALMSIASVSGYRDLKFEPWPPYESPDFPSDENIFEIIAEQDRVLLHPYQDYQPVVDFVVAAANDPQVIAIKQTLYRTSRDSKIVNALRKAAEAGKHVTVVVELRARFDEQRNIDWARKLEDSGVDVVYGVRGLKTHAKICLVVRKESQGIRRYMHFGTGNYNESTAKLYTDISLLTCDRILGNDATAFFNAVTGFTQPRGLQKLAMAPLTLRNRILELIRFETDRANAGKEAAITAKMNSLVDPVLIEALYKASQAGVLIQLNIRGICCLRPGVAGLSDNIRVISIIDRFLEHSRIMHFTHAGDDITLISSADWMPRNLDRRVELLIPVESETCKQMLIDALKTFVSENVKGHVLQPDGSYHRVSASKRDIQVRSQQLLYQRAVKAQQLAKQATPTTFQPHKA